MNSAAVPADALPIDALIQRELPAARGGDRDAYGRIVRACQNTVTAVALAITRDVQASEDIAQEAFLGAWQHLERLHSADSFLPWLRQIARNLARDHLRRHRNTPLDGPNAELAMAVAADPGPQPMEQVLSDEREMAASELISALPEDSRETLLLFYREGQSSQQVALLLGISDAAVRKRLSRARQLVRDELLRRFGEFAQSSAPSVGFSLAVVAALGIASKPAAASVAAAGVLAAGGAAGSKSAAGVLGGVAGSLLGGILGGWLAAHLTRRFLLAYAETLEEREAILADYRLYLIVTMPAVTVMLLVATLVPGVVWTLLATACGMVASLWTLLRIRRRLLPLIARDRARNTPGARARYLAYELSYGPTAIVLSGVLLVLSILVLYFLSHYGMDGCRRALDILTTTLGG